MKAIREIHIKCPNKFLMQRINQGNLKILMLIKKHSIIRVQINITLIIINENSTNIRIIQNKILSKVIRKYMIPKN